MPLLLSPQGCFSGAESARFSCQSFQTVYLNSVPTTLKPIVPVQGLPTHYGGDWSSQYPPSWNVMSGDAYTSMACDSRRLAFFGYCQAFQFNQPLTHDQVGAYVFSRVAGDSACQVAGTFQKSVSPQLMLTPPEGIAQVWFLRWQHPQAGRMFTVMEVSFLAYRNFTTYGVPGISGSTSAFWITYTAPKDEFTAMWKSTFNPIFLSITYVIPNPGGDRDGDGYPDSTDNYPDSPYWH